MFCGHILRPVNESYCCCANSQLTHGQVLEISEMMYHPRRILRRPASEPFPVVAPAEVFLQPDVEADEQIPASHLAYLELALIAPTVPPGNGDHCPCVAAYNCLEWQLYCEVEMWRDEWAASKNDFLAKGLEGVCSVVKLDSEHKT